MVPLDKGGGKARPILLQEALLKLATGTVVAAVACKLEKRLLPYQYGAGGEGGAVQMAWEINAAMAASPGDVFTSFDSRNAFGTVARQAAAAEAKDTCPELVPLLMSLWVGASPTFWLEGPGGEMTAHQVVDGCTQGGCDAQPAFCLAEHRALKAFAQSLTARGKKWRLWAYVDDIFLQCHKEDWGQLADELVKQLRAVGLEQRVDKCKACIPRASKEDVEQMSGEFARHAKLVHGGLPILGSVCGGDFATVVGDPSAATGPAEARLAKAEQLVAELEGVLKAPIECPRAAPVWKMLTAVVNNALSFDSCILVPALSRPLAERLDSIVARLAKSVAQAELPQQAIDQMRLPRNCGGCGIPSAADRCSTAFLATYLRCPPAEGDFAAWEAAGLVSQATEAASHIAGMGAHIDEWGMPHAAKPANPLNLRCRRAQTMPQRQRGWWQTINDKRALALSEQPHGERIPQCAGEEGGVFLTALPSEVGYSLEDEEFRTGLKMRLGLQVCTPGPCQHRAARKDKRTPVCGVRLDPGGQHATSCKIGGEVTVLHDNGCQIILAAARAAGLRALEEQVVPELRTAGRLEPRLDVEAWGSVRHPRLLMDFTVRDPSAARYQQHRAIPAGTAEQGEREKAREYPARGGVAVRGLCMEKLGRHGPNLAQTLHEFADMARQRDVDRGRAPRRWIKLWRAQLSAAAVRSCHRAIATALEDRAGRVSEHGPRGVHACSQPGGHSHQAVCDDSGSSLAVVTGAAIV